MDIQGIKFFLSVAETRSFTESAELCNISQSSLSKSIMRLEQELDVKLFDRTQHPVSLTPAGECFYTHFKPMEQQYADAMEDIRRLRKSTVLRILLCPNAFYYRDACMNFQETHPEIHVELTATSSFDAITKRIQSENFDFCLSTRPFLLPPQIRAHELLKDELLVLISQRYPLSRQKTVSLRELTGYTAIQSNFTRQILLQLMKYFSYAPQSIYPPDDSSIQRHEAIRRIVLGEGIGFFCSRELAGFNLSGARVLRLQEVQELPSVLMERVDLPDSKAKSMFRQWMKENLSRFAYPMLDDSALL